MSLSDFLTNTQKTSLDDDQGPWRQFILDHLSYIAKRSVTYTIEPPLMNRYRYDLKRFLKAHLNRLQDIGWIVLLLNGMYNDFDFVDPKEYVIPSDELIQNLYHSFITISSNKF